MDRNGLLYYLRVFFTVKGSAMASSRQNPALFDLEPDGEQAKRLLVQRVLTSQCFEKATRMRDFLAYVCDHTLNDPKAGICEQNIGCAVFGRLPDYDTNQDNIVRVNASHLRKRLESYFASEGRTESWLLELPKGQYTPVFRPRPEPVDAEKPSEPGETAQATATNPAQQRLIWFLGG